MVEALNGHEHSNKKKSKELFWEALIQVNEQFWVQKKSDKRKKHRDIKPATNLEKRVFLLLQPNYDSKMLLGKSGGDGNEQSKCQNEEASIFRSINFRNKQDCYVSVLGWYDYTKPKYGDNSRLCCIRTAS